jgi:hypothetical protein
VRKGLAVARRCVVAGIVGGLVLAGCGSSSKTADSPTTTATTPGPTAPAKVTVDAADFTFALPSQIPAGYDNVTIRNHGKEGHQIGFIKLGSMTFADFKAAATTTDLNKMKGTTFLAGPNGADPGQSATAMVKLDPGDYAVACFIPANADGKPHAAHGMIAPVKVVKTAESYEVAPKADSTITLSEFKFGLPAGFTGKGLVDVSNIGKQVHELVIVKLNPGKTLNDAKGFFLTPPGTPPPAGPPPFTAIPDLGGITGLGAGQHAWLNMNLTPGNYVMLCFFPDTSDKAGLPHALKGMIKAFQIK